MKIILNPDLNQRIISGFLAGKSIPGLAQETNLDVSYITLVLYQEGIHYSHQEVFHETPYFRKRNRQLS